MGFAASPTTATAGRCTSTSRTARSSALRRSSSSPRTLPAGPSRRAAAPSCRRIRVPPRHMPCVRSRWSIPKDRLLYPMKRVDWDPNGARNTHNRGISGYQRISWDEAFDIVAGEFKRVKHDCGPGAIALSHGSHHTWGNIGYYLSALYRFFNFGRLHQGRPQSRQLGGLVLGGGSPLGPLHAVGRRRGLRPGRGCPQGMLR